MSSDQHNKPLNGAATELQTLGKDVEKSSGNVIETSKLVKWSDNDDAANPKNWSPSKRWATTILVSCFTLLSPVSSTMISPALDAIGADLHVTSAFKLQLSQSVFLLGLGFGPLLLSPLSEIYGRAPILLTANLFYIVWNTASGFAKTIGQLFAFRLLSGFSGSAPLAVGAGVLTDLWKPEKRGKAMVIYTFGPLLGPSLGPIAGGFITEHTTWRWVFWATSIANACVQVFAIFFLHETYASKILQTKAKKLRKETGDISLRTEYDTSEKPYKKILTNLGRPLRLLATQRIIQILAVYMACLYGMNYLVLYTFAGLWITRYDESLGISGLNYLSTAIGYLVGAQIAGRSSDLIYRKLKSQNKNIGTAEFRIPLMIPGSILIPAGMLWYGWTADAHDHWILPNIGVAIFMAGTMICFQSIQTYTVDAYTRYAASAVSTINATRSLAGFGFALFAPYMYDSLGYGWGNTLLAFSAIGLGSLVPLVLWNYGAGLRARSPFAAGG